MKTTLQALSAALLCLMLSACGTSRPLSLVDIPSEPRISKSDRVRVAISTEDRARLDPIIVLGRTNQSVETGAIWFQVFTGRTGDPLFTIKSAKLETETLVLAARMAYTVEGELAYRGRTYPIRARGSRTAAMAMGAASRQAVELGVVDAARRCRAIMEGKTF
jgi:hypothetical protein